MRIAIANQKGGTGKTTTGVGLACAMGADGYRVLLIDTDVDQGGAGTASQWHAGMFRAVAPDIDPLDAYRASDRQAAALAAHRQVGFECLTLNQIQELGFKDVSAWDHVVIDCPPGRPDRIAAAFRLADAAIVPVGTNAAEVSGIGVVRQLIAGLGRPVAMQVLLTRIDARQTAPREVQEAMALAGVEAFRTRIPRRAAIEHLWPNRHPSTCLAGWVAWRDLWAELTSDDPTPAGDDDVVLEHA